MTPEEIDILAVKAKWATIVTVSPDGRPYAIEATPFFMDDSVCFMINPDGATRWNLESNNRVLLKITFASKDVSMWAGVSLEGTGAFSRDPDVIVRGWRALGALMDEDYSDSAAKFSKTPERSPLLMVRVDGKSGRCSAKPGEPMPAYWKCRP
jgi:hypothetical protein